MVRTKAAMTNDESCRSRPGADAKHWAGHGNHVAVTIACARSFPDLQVSVPLIILKRSPIPPNSGRSCGMAQHIVEKMKPDCGRVDRGTSTDRSCS